MSGLFMSPDAVAIAEAQQRAALAAQDPVRAVGGTLFNLGNAGGNALIRGAGGDSRSPLERRAATIQNIAADVDFQDADSIMAGANALNDAGFQAEAFQMLRLMPEPAEPVDQFSQPYLLNVPGSVRPIVVKRDLRTGEVFKIDAANAPQESGGGSNVGGLVDLPNVGDLSLDEDQGGFLMSALKNFRGFEDVDFEEEENVAQLNGLRGLVVQNANELHTKAIDEFLPEVRQYTNRVIMEEGRPLTREEVSRLNQYVENNRNKLPNSSELMREATDDLLRSGKLEQYVDQWWGLDDNLQNPAEVGTGPSAESTAVAADREDRLRAEEASVQERAGDSFRPRINSDNQFAVPNLNTEGLLGAFQRGVPVDDQAMVERVQELGYDMPTSQNALNWHQSRWDFIRSNPAEVAQFTTMLSSDADQARNYLNGAIDAAWEAGDGVKAGELAFIADYFKHFKGKRPRFNPRSGLRRNN